MSELMKRYTQLIEMMSPDERKFVNHQSLKNSIIHFDEITDEIESEHCLRLIEQCINDIETNEEKFDLFTAHDLFIAYIQPLSKVYKKIGFIKFIPLHYRILISVPIDIIFGSLFLNFPYPILTFLSLLHYGIKRMRYKDTSKYFSVFY